ncbi:MAG TPA: response regulator transcription factor [Gaiellaceae bacterium]|nr:response regulator transcription factor [Gaiellaceae bacterium]
MRLRVVSIVAAAHESAGRPTATDVFVVGRVRVHRESIAAALADVASVRVVGEAATLDDAVAELSGRERPAVALLDCPRLGDLVVAAPLSSAPEAKLVCVGVPEDEGVEWIEAGASGFVPPEGSLEDVIVALERVADDELAAPPRVAAHLATRVRHLAAGSARPSREERLTARETEVLDLLEEGLSNKQIARRLSIQEQTAKNHVHSVLRKLGVSRRAEAAAQRAGRRPRRSRY